MRIALTLAGWLVGETCHGGRLAPMQARQKPAEPVAGHMYRVRRKFSSLESDFYLRSCLVLTFLCRSDCWLTHEPVAGHMYRKRRKEDPQS